MAKKRQAEEHSIEAGLLDAGLGGFEDPVLQDALCRLCRRLGVPIDSTEQHLWAMIGLKLTRSQPEFNPAKKKRGRPKGSVIPADRRGTKAERTALDEYDQAVKNIRRVTPEDRITLGSSFECLFRLVPDDFKLISGTGHLQQCIDAVGGKAKAVKALDLSEERLSELIEIEGLIQEEDEAVKAHFKAAIKSVTNNQADRTTVPKAMRRQRSRGVKDQIALILFEHQQRRDGTK